MSKYGPKKAIFKVCLCCLLLVVVLCVAVPACFSDGRIYKRDAIDTAKSIYFWFTDAYENKLNQKEDFVIYGEKSNIGTDDDGVSYAVFGEESPWAKQQLRNFYWSIVCRNGECYVLVSKKPLKSFDQLSPEEAKVDSFACCPYKD